MGIFDEISGALSGKPQAAPAPQSGTAGKAGYLSAAEKAYTLPPDVLAAKKAFYAKQTAGTTSGLDSAMQQHADQLHPVNR